MQHPNSRYFADYDEYRLAMDEWDHTHTFAKIIADRNYKANLYERNKQMATTFNIKKRDNAPDFVVGSFGCKLGDLEAYVNSKGYINFDILKGKEGGLYIKINEYGLDKGENASVTKIDELTDEEIPF